MLISQKFFTTSASLVLVGAFIAPLVASAQYVPVIDINMQQLFPQYMSDFNSLISTNPDSLRNIISGAGPTGAKYYPDVEYPEAPPPIICELRKVQDDPFAYTDLPPDETPWRRAFGARELDANGNPTGPRIIPVDEFIGAKTDLGTPPGTSGGEIQVNDSTSLTCLLQELVEWKKLELFLKIHNMIREYVSDVQAAQLAQKLEGLVAKANTDWARQGIERCTTDPTNGEQTCITDSVAGTQPTEFTNKLTGARARTIEQMTVGGTPAGSLNVCSNWKLDAAADIAGDALRDTTDSFDLMLPVTQCALTNQIDPAGAAFASETDADTFFNGSFNTGQYGGWVSFLSTLRNSSNSRLGAQTDLLVMQRKQLEDVRREFELERLAPGYFPDIECSGLPNDPNCDPRFARIVTNAGLVGGRVNSYAAFGDETIAKTDFSDNFAATSTMNQSMDILTKPGGFDAYDTTGIGNITPPLDEYVREIYGAMEYGYFDLYEETQDWAQGALLNIYDTMSFSANLYGANKSIPGTINPTKVEGLY